MKKLDVVLPTYMRQDKLIQCVRSIAEARLHCNPVLIHVHIYFSLPEEMEEVKEFFAGKQWISYHLLHGEFIASDFWNAHIEGMEADALCYLTDDTILDPFCLIRGWECLERLGFDGVVGFNISNATDGHPVKAAYGMVSKRFADRFPDRQVFCPEYACLYMDEELEIFAKSINRFQFCEEAKLQHFHPSFTGKAPDFTHVHHRRNKFRDTMIHGVRKDRNLIWGSSFEKVGILEG